MKINRWALAQLPGCTAVQLIWLLYNVKTNIYSRVKIFCISPQFKLNDDWGTKSHPSHIDWSLLESTKPSVCVDKCMWSVNLSKWQFIKTVPAVFIQWNSCISLSHLLALRVPTDLLATLTRQKQRELEYHFNTSFPNKSSLNSLACPFSFQGQKNSSALSPQWGCKPWHLQAAIVSIINSVLHSQWTHNAH